jgi:hypothetical protein
METKKCSARTRICTGLSVYGEQVLRDREALPEHPPVPAPSCAGPAALNGLTHSEHVPPLDPDPAAPVRPAVGIRVQRLQPAELLDLQQRLG